MPKRLIWILIIIMTFALIALVILQGYWLKNAFKVKEDHFRQQVTQALTEICKRAESRETIIEISNEMFSLNNGSQNIPEFYNNAMLFDSAKNRIAVSRQSVLFNKTKNIHSNTKITILNGDSVIFNKIISKCKPENFCNNISQIDIGKELKNKMNNKTLFVEKIVNKLLNFNEDISKRLDKSILNAIIESELKNQGVNISYEFAVKNNESKIAYSSINYNPNSKDIYKIQLFPNDLFSPSYFLHLYFPRKDNFIVKSLGYMSTSSILLILIVIFSYTLTLIIILKQKKLSEMKNDFINNMTHELKTPISTISLASQMLKDKSVDKDFKSLNNIAVIIEEESKRLGYQVEKVLQMAIFEQSNFKFRIENIDIHYLISGICNNFSIQVEKRGGTLTTKLEATKLFVEGDEVHLSTMLLNLLENAIKYCDKEPLIVVSTKDANKGMYISVKDNGLGINSEDQKRIFEKFYRVHTGNIHNVKGFGLGLSYVKIICDAHGGSIKIESELNKGSEFIIYLPFKHQKI
ncbi:MAG: sensor histidine kinase [Bacteroidetes bacterium CG02_land_8_20_14_3_00_31_25]|nr:MAG: sensor histidine kinase [Bacteroidetes bacterium CG02_land_8_20_14_3_00_31_25]PIX32613.1 MAG: sensor histidine kinase [Bacteroidetes bacterium CG_4_8_14_3_um_filter_31_14]PIY03283.1 MAG: sensor histidine kinase [Bacteroidetes bacterium CG_4_10_14_3_um_filter_31_20]